MGLFKKLFGRKPAPPAHAPAVDSAPTNFPAVGGDLSNDPNLIRVYDAYGREMYITRQQWRDSVLVGSIAKAWNEPDQLSQMIALALNDGFRADVIKAAEQLYKIDPDRTRGACTWAVVLMQEGRLDESEAVLREHLRTRGDDGWILNNLAKVYYQRKNEAESEKLLWRSLEVDPNHENSVGWYQSLHEERGGASARLAALRKLAQLPGSWRALLWLAREELEANRLHDAVLFYQQALSRAPAPIPADLLQQMSGDLGKHGRLKEIITLAEPHYDAKEHGLAVGNNFIKAHLDLGQFDEARALVDQLYAFDRFDWKDGLAFWETEITKARLAGRKINRDELGITIATLEGPVWLPPDTPADELFPPKPKDELLICFLGSSVRVPTETRENQTGMSDNPGRMSRGLPLYLAEQTFFSTHARVATLVPLLTSGASGFARTPPSSPGKRSRRLTLWW